MSIRLLLADDSITIQKVIGIIFGGDEFSLTVVDNGKAAVEKAREITPDVMLIDVLMPGMSGYEVTEAVRAIPELSTKPILLLTGSFEPFDEDKAKRCGADDFIAKPFESQQIISKVKELVSGGSNRPAAAASPAVQAQAPAPVQPPPAAIEPEPVAVQNDVWGALAVEEESPVAPLQDLEPSSGAVDVSEPDVFSMVSEAAEIAPVVPEILPEAGAAVQQQSIGSTWVPVEEQTFEFQDQFESANPLEAAAEQPSIQPSDLSFGDIAFGDEAQAPEVILPEPVSPVQLQPAPFAPEPPPAVELPASRIVLEDPLSSLPAFAEPEIPAFSAPEPPQFELPPAEAAPAAFSAPVKEPMPFDASAFDVVQAIPEPVPAAPVAPVAPIVAPAAPVFDVPAPEPAAIEMPAAQQPAPVLAAAAAAEAPLQPAPALSPALSEDQLKAAVASLSKDVIERIVWEVVPDLAEAMIKEAIRKIKEGA